MFLLQLSKTILFLFAPLKNLKSNSVIGGIEIGEQLLEREGFGKFSLV